MTERIHRLPMPPRPDTGARVAIPFPVPAPAAGGGGQVRPPARPQRTAYAEPDLFWLVKALWRRWWLILLVFLVTTGAVYTLLQLKTPQYSASTDLILERDETQFANLREGLDFRSRELEPAEMETYLRVLGSDQVALGVLDRLGLEERQQPGRVKPWAPLLTWLQERSRGVLAAASELLGIEVAEPAAVVDQASPGDPQEERLAEFRRRLEITRDPLAHVIKVSFTSPDPQRAALVANTTAQLFLEELVGAQRASLVQNADYLGERVEALRKELDQAETSSTDYQSKRELYQVQGGSADELRYAELMREVLVADAEASRARARQAQIGTAGQNLAGIAEGLSSPVITDLRRQEAEVARQLADLRSSFGEKHPMMIKTRAELDDIRRNIREEQGRIAAQVRGELQVAEQRAASVKAELAKAEQKLNRSTGARAQLNTLDSRADTTRRMYEDMLERYQRATEQQHLLRPAARVISPARPPSDPDTKKNILILGFVGFSSIAGGMGLALLMELTRRGYETAEELESHTHVPVFGSLPLVGRRAQDDYLGTSNELAAIVFAEAVQRLSVRVLPPGHAQGQGQGQVVMMTSALPNEGKTTVSLSLARQMAAAGLQVVLVDADLRKRSLEAQVERAPGRRSGLIDLLSGNIFDLGDALVRDDRSGLDFLLANHTPPQPLRLLGSPAMAQLIDELRRRYDVVLLDTPPVLALSDYAVLAPLVDQLLFVVHWRATSRRAVQTALRELAANDAPLAGLVLNQVKLGAYRKRTDGDSLSYYKATTRYYRTS